MARVDHDALVDSMKVLCIIFIITIFLSSLILLMKLVLKYITRQPEKLLKLRRLMVCVLTCGTMLFALFPLIVTVRIQYEEIDFYTSCKTLILSSVYENFFFPFVYAMGLIVLAAELYLTKRSSDPPSITLRFLCVSFPWIFGVILVLPLTMAGINWDFFCAQNFSIARHRSFVWICNLLPAITVLLVAIFLAFKVGGDGNDYSNNPSVPYSNSTQRVVTSSSSSSSYGGGFQQAAYSANPPAGVIIPTAPPSSLQRPDSSHFHQPSYDYGSPPPSYKSCAYQPHQVHHHQPPQYQHLPENVKQQQQHHSQQPPPTYPPPPPPNYAPPPPGFGTPYYEYDHNTGLPNHHLQNIPQSQSFSQADIVNNPHTNPGMRMGAQATSAVPEFRDRRNEAKTFAKVAALFVFCSFPQAIFNLAYTMNEDRVKMDALSAVVISQLVSWLTVLRWLLLNICWISSFKD